MQIGNITSGKEEFDFVFSFAGEDRELVEKIHNRLSAQGLKVFYDNTYQAQLVGMDLYRTLRDIYRNKGKFVVCFISEHYAKKVWTNLEFTAIKERLMETFFVEGFLIPIKIGNADMLEDIPEYIGFYPHKTVDETVEMLRRKISSSVEEDILFGNINNFIQHLYKKVLEKLCQHCSDVERIGDLLVIRGQRETLKLRFSPDIIAHSPCLLVFTRNDSGCEAAFPAVVITWSRYPNLRFSINVFSEFVNGSQDNLTLEDVVSGICSYAEKHAGNEALW